MIQAFEARDVSVVIPAHNAEATLPATLQSVLAQTSLPGEIVVVDDGSTDDTAATATRFGPLVRVVTQVNAGVGAARNAGVTAARLALIAFVDSDDLWHPDKLRAQITALNRAPDVGIVFGEFRPWNPDDPPEFPTEGIDDGRIVEGLSGWLYHKLLLTNWVLTSTELIRREVFERTGLFDPSLRSGEDWDFLLRASRHFRFLKLHDVVTLYRQHPNQTTRRAWPVDYEDLVRSTAIERFGTCGPDGAEVDRSALRQRRFKGHLNFGLRHLEAGDPRVALQAFLRALACRPTALRTVGYAVAAAWRCASQRPVNQGAA
jgi:glycosyltransferase involved in cell wall biosynthesis